jgi:ubiquitin carboxyl-terminal hydrolase 4/11/15
MAVQVIHLKRFSHSRYSRDKIEAFVDYPLDGLDLTTRIAGPNDEPAIYDLYAISNHFGGLGGGHYTYIFAFRNFD